MILHTKKKFLRKAFFSMIAIGAVVFAIANIANKIGEQTIAMSGDGDAVELVFDSNDKIFYGERRDDSQHQWEGDRGATHWFTTVTQNNGSYTAFCSQPTKKPLAGDFQVEYLNDNNTSLSPATRKQYKMMKLMIFAATNGGPGAVNDTNIQSAATGLMNYLFDSYTLTGLDITSSNTRLIYAYTHAVLGLIYDVDYTGTIATSELRSHEPYVRGIIAKLANIVDGTVTTYNTAYVMSQSYNLYTVNRYESDIENPDEYQDIVWIESPELGRIQIQKKDYDTTTAQGDANLAGIPFQVKNISGREIYDPVNKQTYANGAVIRTGSTDVNGKITFTVPIGKYEVTETGTNSFYRQTDVTPKTAEIISYRSEDVGLPFANKVHDEGGIKVYKKDKDTGGCSALGSASLANTKFSLYNKSSQPIYYNGRTIAVDGLVDTKTISSSSCFVTFTGLPYGRYDVVETTTGSGYLPDTDNQNNTAHHLVTVPTSQVIELTIYNQVKRGNVKFKKIDINDNNAPMANVAFRITSRTTGESHIVVTDANGEVDTSRIAHTSNTNGYDREVHLGVVGPAEYVYHDNYGTWFYGNLNESGTVSNSLGALPYDNYTLTELACDTNEFCYNIENLSVNFSVTNNSTVSVTLSGSPFENDCVHHAIGTTAYDPADGDKYIMVDDDAVIRDRVGYHAMRGKSYTISGALYDRESGEPLGVTQSVDFTVGNSEDGYQDLDFTIDTTTLAGHSIVVYEELIYNGTVVAEHKERTDDQQTVYVIDFGTTAVDKADQDKYIVAEGNVTITDTIDYCLIPGQTFTFVGTLYDKTAGALLPNITSSTTITPTSANRCSSATIDFTFNADALAGHTIVVYEKLYHDNVVIMTHEDASDADQTVYLINFGTTAVDKADQDKYIINEADMIIEDTIDYCLVAGQDFRFDATLYNKLTGEFLVDNKGELVSYSLSITPTTPCGSAKVELKFDARGLDGHDLVVFEKLYHEDDLIMTHEDEDDSDQTVRVISFGTTASDQVDSDKYVIDGDKVIIRDRIKYCLVAGKQFTVEAYLVDKATGEPIEGKEGDIVSRSYGLKESVDCGSFVASFEVDATALAGHDLVAFERVLDGDDVILTHEDLLDENQTVRVVSLETFATSNQDELEELDPNSEVVITDRVVYCLRAGKEFTFVGRLMDKATKKPVVINDEELVETVTFTPEEDCGEFTITYTFPAKGMAKKVFVILEELYDEAGRRILLHDDYENENETVKLPPNTGFETDDQSGANDNNATAIIVALGMLGVAAFVVVRNFGKIFTTRDKFTL